MPPAIAATQWDLMRPLVLTLLVCVNYPYMLAWGAIWDLPQGQVWSEVHRALVSHAPDDALFWMHVDHKWVTVADIKNPDTLRQVDALARRLCQAPPSTPPLSPVRR